MALSHLQRSARGLGRFAVGSAWFFIVVTLLHLAWVLWVKWDSPAGLATLYRTDVGDHVYRAWGLSYEGVGGLLQAIGQAIMVVTAATLSVLPWLRARRAGHAVLVVWAAWWAMSLGGLAYRDHQLDTLAQTALLTALLGCTLYRAWLGWWPRRRRIEVVIVPEPVAPGTPAETSPPRKLRRQVEHAAGASIDAARRGADKSLAAARRGAASAGKVADRVKHGRFARDVAARARRTASRTMTWLREHGVVPAQTS